MSFKKRPSIAIALLGFLIIFSAYGSDAFAKGGRGRRQGPPPEAYTACEGKSAGDSAEFESPHGDKVTGTCVEEGDRLVLRPDNPPPDGGRPTE